MQADSTTVILPSVQVDEGQCTSCCMSWSEVYLVDARRHYMKFEQHGMAQKLTRTKHITNFVTTVEMDKF